ncbi:MAG: hypothetical protein FJY09_03145 [Chlorobi bacterium]|nr:hypothetical protein [Chlorobiota bacterium]
MNTTGFLRNRHNRPARPSWLPKGFGVAHNLKTGMTMIYQKQAEKGKQCQDCQSFIVSADNPSEGICNGNNVLAEGGCMFFKRKEESAEQQ